MIRLAVVLTLLSFGGFAEASAQCWDCGTDYWPGDDCWIDSCYSTDGAGSANCSQYGECGDVDTCSANGHGCEGFARALLDGRADVGLRVDAVSVLVADADTTLNQGISTRTQTGRFFVTLQCNGFVVSALYTPMERDRLREESAVLVL